MKAHLYHKRRYHFGVLFTELSFPCLLVKKHPNLGADLKMEYLKHGSKHEQNKNTMLSHGAYAWRRTIDEARSELINS